METFVNLFYGDIAVQLYLVGFCTVFFIMETVFEAIFYGNLVGVAHFESHPDGTLYVEDKIVYKVHSEEHYYEILRKWGHYGRK